MGTETLEENALNRAVMEAIHRITSDDMEFMENFRQNIIHVIGNYSTAKESEEYEEKIKEKQEEMVALIVRMQRLALHNGSLMNAIAP